MSDSQPTSLPRSYITGSKALRKRIATTFFVSVESVHPLELRKANREWVASKPEACVCGSKSVAHIMCWQFPHGSCENYDSRSEFSFMESQMQY